MIVVSYFMDITSNFRDVYCVGSSLFTNKVPYMFYMNARLSVSPKHFLWTQVL